MNKTKTVLIDCIPYASFILMEIAFQSYWIPALCYHDLDFKLKAIAYVLLNIMPIWGLGGKFRNTGILWGSLAATSNLIDSIFKDPNVVTINEYVTLALIILAPFFVQYTQRRTHHAR